jgi:uncharacterized protein
MPWLSPSADQPSYRRAVRSELESWRVVVGESDLFVSSERSEVDATAAFLRGLRLDIQRFVAIFPSFGVTLEAFRAPEGTRMPLIVAAMAEAGGRAGVGPMAAVAGAIAEAVARALSRSQAEVIVENGGDIFLISRKRRVCAIYAGTAPFSLRLGIALGPDQMPCSVCTSSGTVGPSLSFGKADAGIVVAESGAVADALATALTNRIQTERDLEPAVQWARAKPGVIGALAILGKSLAVQGDVELVEI